MARPETETDADSLADRIRHLERQIQSGHVRLSTAGVQAEEPISCSPSAVYEEPASYEPDAFYSEMSYYGPSEPPAPPVQEDASGKETGQPGQTKDLRQQIIGSCDNPRIRFILGKCTTDLTEGTLRIAAPSIIALKQLKEESTLQTIRQLAQSAAGRQIDVQAVLKEADTEQCKTQFPEEVLSNINFTIGTEEW